MQDTGRMQAVGFVGDPDTGDAAVDEAVASL
jgi:hypothetical protein